MTEPVQYTKLSALVGSSFTVEKVGDYVFKKWSAEESKMLTSQSYAEGYRKVYPVTTSKGLLDLGTGQLGGLFETVSHAGSSEIIGKTFSVKSNGETGINIRYYLNPVKAEVHEEPLDTPESW